jgi:putative molybdopterin biosynthesis protein
MAYQYLTNLPLEEAREKYLAALMQHGLQYKQENIPATDALERVSAAAVYAKISAPHYNACAMDGVALDSALTFGASERTPVEIRDNQFTWVNTGDPLPAGCDAVVMVEDVIGGDGFITLYTPAVPWENIRQIGEDISAGDMIIPSYTVITPAIIGALLAAGVLQVSVITRPVVGIIPTGDELVLPTDTPQPGQIIEFNSSIISAMLGQWGCASKRYPIARDDQAAIEAALKTALSECDAVILLAGSSAGKKDHAVSAIRSVGEVIVHGIAIKPGKPAILALADAPNHAGAIPLLGLPGYPVSGMLVMEHLYRPVIEVMTGRYSLLNEQREVEISRRLTSSLKYHEFIRATLGEVNGKLVAVPLSRGAGVVSSMVKADGILQVPQNMEGCEQGERVMVQLLRSMPDIERALVVTGSHDPLIDEAADILRRAWPGSRVTSSHVGSMGGILAVKRGEAHLGGIHLLDETTGEYNISFLRRYFPEGEVALVEGVRRTQGLMVKAGNPLKINSLADLTHGSYVNRQKGSGTRILFDHLLKQEQIDPAGIIGYGREEYTHSAVGASIAAGSADAGLGIYSAARIFGLDFIPIYEEQYDLLVLQDAMELEIVQRLLEVLRGEEFSHRLAGLGGYKLVHPGELRTWN